MPLAASINHVQDSSSTTIVYILVGSSCSTEAVLLFWASYVEIDEHSIKNVETEKRPKSGQKIRQEKAV